MVWGEAGQLVPLKSESASTEALGLHPLTSDTRWAEN